MKGISSSIQMCQPTSLDEALSLLEKEPGLWQIFAGGTDLMVEHERGAHADAHWMSLAGIEELKKIRITDEEICISACANYRDILTIHQDIPELKLLQAAASQTAAPAVQARGTLGGNVANASPAADSVPALLALNATLHLQSARGSRHLPIDEFYLGYRETALQKDELIREINIPRTHWNSVYFRKVGTRRAQAISKVVMAAAAKIVDGKIHARIALGSVAAIPLRCRRTEEALHADSLDENTLSAARQALQEEITPIDDLRSTADYRRRVSNNLLAEFTRRINRQLFSPSGDRV